MQKKIIGTIPMCYSTSAMPVGDSWKLIYAGEGDGRLVVYDGPAFSHSTVVWDEQDKLGGTMSICPVEDEQDSFFASTGFFDMVHSETSAIWLVQEKNGIYREKCVCRIPYLHRFDVTRVGNRRFLIACTLHSGKKDPSDWSTPGKILVGELPLDLSGEVHTELTVLRDDLFQNHGFNRIYDHGVCKFGVATRDGVFLVTPPQNEHGKWDVRCVLPMDASDVCAMDLDGDGELEYGLIRPFHGDRFEVYKSVNGQPELVYAHPKHQNFTHAIHAGLLNGIPCFAIGARGGDQEIFLLHYAPERGYCTRSVEMGAGPSNVCMAMAQSQSILLAANREKDEAALYCL